MPVVHIVRYFRQPLWAVEVDDSRFGGHGFYSGEAARAPSVGLDDFLTETLTQWKLATFRRILRLDLQANGFHTFYSQSLHMVLTWTCAHACIVFLVYWALLLP